MNIKNFDLLCDPKTHKSLKYTGTALEAENGKIYHSEAPRSKLRGISIED